MNLLHSEYFALFVIIAIGFLLGRIKIKDISLDISAIIFVALLFGHYGVHISNSLQQIGLLFFISTVGIQAGPGFIRSFKKKGLQLLIFTLILIVIGAATTIAFSFALGIDKKIAIGLFTGALTSTPGLAVAIDATKSTLASIGYGIAYPFGVLGVILFIRIFPKLLGSDIQKSEKEVEKETLLEYPEIVNMNFIVENTNIIGKTIGSLKIRSMTGANISRVLHEGEAIAPTADTQLYAGDLMKAVGSRASLEKVRLLIGKTTEKTMPLSKDYEVISVLVTNKKVVNKTIRQLNLLSNYNVTITRVTRSGIMISPTPGLHIKFADKLTVAGGKEVMKQVVKLLGNDDKRLSDTDFLPLAAGIILGILVGKIKIDFSSTLSISPGLTGGVLIVALILGNLGKTGPLIWTMSGTANLLLRQLGLIFFLAAVGTNAGAHIADIFHNYGLELFLVGAAITILPMLITAIIAHYFLKMNMLVLLGTLAGSMTSTPGLAAADSYSRSNAAQVAYATVYPIAMVFLIICVQIMSNI
jgi:putative transport protein